MKMKNKMFRGLILLIFIMSSTAFAGQEGSAGNFVIIKKAAKESISKWLDQEKIALEADRISHETISAELLDIFVSAEKKLYFHLAYTEMLSIESPINESILKNMREAMFFPENLEIVTLKNFNGISNIIVDSPETINLQELIFINIPGKSTTQGRLLINLEEYQNTFLKNDIVKINYKENNQLISLKVKSSIMREALLVHELFGIAGVNDRLAEHSGLLPYAFSDEFHNSAFLKIKKRFYKLLSVSNNFRSQTLALTEDTNDEISENLRERKKIFNSKIKTLQGYFEKCIGIGVHKWVFTRTRPVHTCEKSANDMSFLLVLE